MSKRLIVYLGEHWPRPPAAPWVLLDGAGRVVESGHSEPAHWPTGVALDVVLSPLQGAVIDTRLPKGSRSGKEQQRLLAYALEERLVHDPDSQHVVVARRSRAEAGVSVRVVVMARVRLRQLLAQLAQLQRTPVRMTLADASALPGAGGAGWRLWWLPDDCLLWQREDAPSLSVDAALAGELLSAALATLPAAPAHITLHGSAPSSGGGASSGVDDERVRRLGDGGHDIALGEAVPWWLAATAGAQLLDGEFAPRGGGSAALAGLRGPLVAAALVGAAFVLVTAGEVLWQRQQLEQVEARMARVFETALPGTPAVVPAVQLQRALDDARSRNGQLRQDDFLALLAVLADAGEGGPALPLAAIDYRPDGLRLHFAGAVPVPPTLAARLMARGYRLSTEGGQWVLKRVEGGA